MKVELKETQDGSHTLYLNEIDEHYHSTYGAIQESLHVFIHAGFDSCMGNDVRILEIGFGTGLNCYLTLLASLQSDKTVRYFSLEKFPLDDTIWEQLNYAKNINPEEKLFFPALHRAPWNCSVKILPKFELYKIESDLVNYNFEEIESIDLVYFDAFSPDKQPELWSKPVFESICARMKENGILVTYCAKGYVRRLLQSIGFQVDRIPGPPGKREMIKAVKKYGRIL